MLRQFKESVVICVMQETVLVKGILMLSKLWPIDQVLLNMLTG